MRAGQKDKAMKFLAIASSPKLTLTRTRRKCIVNEITELITLYESTVKIEVTLPSIWQGLKNKIENIATNYLINLFSNNLAMGTR
jgi:hypothetical protein